MGELLRPLRRRPRSRTRPTASAGSSRSTDRSRPRCRRSAPRSAASSTRAPSRSSTSDGRVVFYLGDDERFDYVYKFVTAGTFNPDDRAANMDLLDEGTLYVAKFDEDGTLQWLPLVHGEGPLTAENGFASRRPTSLIETRRAADLLGATKMDRPEDIQPNGSQRQGLRDADQQHASARPSRSTPPTRAPRTPSATSSRSPRTAATSPRPRGTWEVLLKCGDPSVAEVGATFSTATTANGWFGMPDNCAIDSMGRLWVSTDGKDPKATGRTDGLWAVDTEGEARGDVEAVLPRAGRRRAVRSAVHAGRRDRLRRRPASGATAARTGKPFGRPSYYEDLSTRWPDFDDAHAGPSVGRRHHQAGRRQDRGLATDPSTSHKVIPAKEPE